MNFRAARATVGRTAVALIISAAVTCLTIIAAHGRPAEALRAAWDGSLSTPYALSTTLTKAIPLLLTGLGVAIAFRARMFNIGGEGQFLAGAMLASFVATWPLLAHHTPSFITISAMVIAGVTGGAVWGGIAAVLKTWRRVPEVISTIMLNFIAAQLLSFLVNGPMERADHSQPSTEPLSAAATLPAISTYLPVHAGIVIAIVAAFVVWVLLARTVFGFMLDIVGDNPEAARLAAMPVERTVIGAMLWSGGLCGLAGALELSGVIGFLPEGYTPTYGFTAIAVALLGRLKVSGIVLSALLFAILLSGSDNMERSAGIAHELGYVMQGITLLVLLASQWSGWSGLLTRWQHKTAVA